MKDAYGLFGSCIYYLDAAGIGAWYTSWEADLLSFDTLAFALLLLYCITMENYLVQSQSRYGLYLQPRSIRMTLAVCRCVAIAD
jgi:hypothetical protein